MFNIRKIHRLQLRQTEIIVYSTLNSQIDIYVHHKAFWVRETYVKTNKIGTDTDSTLWHSVQKIYKFRCCSENINGGWRILRGAPLFPHSLEGAPFSGGGAWADFAKY